MALSIVDLIVIPINDNQNSEFQHIVMLSFKFSLLCSVFMMSGVRLSITVLSVVMLSVMALKKLLSTILSCFNKSSDYLNQAMSVCLVRAIS